MWMRDFPRPKAEWESNAAIGHPLRFVLQVGIENPLLTDELYVQLCKQLVGNPDVVKHGMHFNGTDGCFQDGSVGQGWIMLIAFLSFFPPSYSFEPALAKYLREVEVCPASAVEHQYRHIARQCQRRLQVRKT